MSLRQLSISQRQQFIKTQTKSDLKNIKSHCLNLGQIEGHNCEQTIGACQIPLAVVGPAILITDQFGSHNKYIPLATTEGALVASVQRGLKACQKGINTFSELIGTTRGPYLEVSNITQAKKIIKHLNQNWTHFQSLVSTHQSHIKLLSFDSQILGKHLYLRFYFDTAEAMGMNMATIATDQILKLLQKKFNNLSFLTSGNFCIDKKPALVNALSGRGQKVWAEAIIDKQIIAKVLKTTPAAIIDTVNKKQHLGSIASGSIAFNAHFANITAAFYLATGQDLAHVVEGSLGITTANLDDDNLYFSIYLPAVMIATIGGGTHLPTQLEALQILNLDQATKKSSHLLAQILAACVLAGELSLTAALASQDLVKAHQSLGRSQA